MVETISGFTATRHKPRPLVVALVVLLHLGLFYFLVRALAPGAVASVERSVVSAFTVTVSAPELEPEPAQEPDAGAQGEPGREAIPKPVVAPKPKVPIERATPAPRASSTGTANTSGATESGTGTGASGSGSGTGSGAGGSGRGGGIATKPEIISGSINSASDFPIPPGGREARIGTSVIVRVIVGIDGRASNCSVYRPSPDPETDRVTCRLVVERLRFRPATDMAGNPVAAPFYYQQRFFS